MEIMTQRLKKARFILDFTRREAAEKIGIDKQYLADIETGRRTPSIKMLGRLSKVYGVPIYWFFLPEGVEDVMPLQVHIASSDH